MMIDDLFFPACTISLLDQVPSCQSRLDHRLDISSPALPPELSDQPDSPPPITFNAVPLGLVSASLYVSHRILYLVFVPADQVRYMQAS